MSQTVRCPLIPRDHWSLLMLLPSILMAVFVCGCRAGAAAPKEEDAEKEQEAIVVRTQPAQRRTIAQVVQGLGSCEALLQKTATLSPAVEGQVREILAKPGDAVKAGQPIVQFDTRIAEANFNEKKATRDGLEASLRLLKTLPRAEEQAQYRLAIDDAKVSVEKAASVVDRLRPLLERGEIPQQQMLEAKLALDQAKVQQQKAESQLIALMLPPRPEAVEEAKVRITVAAATLASVQGQRDLLTIRAPIDGILDKITCKLGQTLTVGTPIGEVVDSRQLYALVWLPMREASQVAAGQPARVRFSESPAADKVEAENAAGVFPGKVASVGQVVDPQTGNLPVRVLVDNPQGRLRLGQMVSVAITVREKANLLSVPVAAISDLGEGPLLSVVRNGKSLILYPQLGMTDQQWVEVVGIDLKPGELVVVEGNYNLPDDTPVTPKPGDAQP